MDIKILNRQLISAVYRDNIDEIKYLIAAGADINKADYHGWSPLHVAAKWGEVQVARVLIEAGAKTDLSDSDGQCPLHLAAIANNVLMSRILIDAGADTDMLNKEGYSPREYASTPEMKEVFTKVERIKESIKESKAIFSRAMQEGWVDIKIVQLTIMGPPAVGKTSFIHLLFNWPAPKRHHSTPIGNRPIRAIQRVAGQDEGNVWSIVGIPELKQMMAEAARLLGSYDGRKIVSTSSYCQSTSQQLASEGNNPSCIEGKGTHQVILPLSATTAEQSSVPSPTDMDDEDVFHSKLIPDPSQFPEDILQSVAHGKTSGALYESTWIHVLDKGGQPQFSDISRVFIHGNIVNIIVLKLMQRLDDKPTFAYSINGKQLSQPAVLRMTYIQLIQSLVRSVVSSKYTVSKGKLMEEVKPLFFIIGSYYDYTHGVKGFLKTIETLQEKNKQLVHALREYKDHLVFYNEPNEELIFPVNNLCQKNRKRISSNIRHYITCSNKPVPIKIPIRWYMFEIKVKEESLKVAHGLVTLDTCEQIGIKLGIVKQELYRCIEYLNSFSLFLYFPVLPHVVFTNPQYLLDMVTSLVRVSFVDYPQELLAKGLVLPPGMQRKLCREGLFTEELLDYIDLEFIPDVFTKDHLITLLQHLLIIAPVNMTTPIKYFLPSALPPQYPSEEDIQSFSLSCEPLLLLFKNRVIPQGLFLALVVALLGRNNVPRFSLDTSTHQQLRYAIHLDSEIMDGSVILVDSYDWLEMYYTGFPGSHCRSLLQAVMDVLPICTETLHYDSSVAHVSPTLRCQNKHEKSVPVHPAKLSYADGIMVAKCTQQNTLPGIKLTDKRHLAWFPQCTHHKAPQLHISSSCIVSQNEIDDVLITVNNREEPIKVECQAIPFSPKPGKTQAEESIIPVSPIRAVSIHDHSKYSTSPVDIFTRHVNEILGVMSDPDTERLPNDLSSANLIPYSVKDDVITTKGLSRYQKASILLNEIERSLRHLNTPEILENFCLVLLKQESHALKTIAGEMLKELGPSEDGLALRSHENLLVTTDSDSPLDIFTRHMCDILGAISDSDTERLSNDLSSAKLIPYSVKDDLISTKGLSRYQKASTLMNEIDRSCRQANQPEILKIFCNVLKKQENLALTRIAEDMLTELGDRD